MSEPADPNDTATEVGTITYECVCGHQTLIASDEAGFCAECGREILVSVSAAQAVTLTSEDDQETDFVVRDGIDRSGENLGHFRLVNKLGQGGMGAVYRAFDESLQRYVAVKVLRTSLEGGTGDGQVGRLLGEAVAQARLNHPHVVTIYYVGREGEEPFFAMELLLGSTLECRLKEGPLPFPKVIQYAQQISSALIQARDQGLVHGDIKPSNLLLNSGGTLKLGDFGLARTDQSSERSRSISGTLHYMAPELTEGDDPTIQSDMYAFGATLFELTFGIRPFAVKGKTLQDRLHSHRIAKVEYPEKWPSTVPERWRRVLDRLLADDPDDRFTDYEELQHELHALEPVGQTRASVLVRSAAYGIDLAVQYLLMLPFMFPGIVASQVTQFDTDPAVVNFVNGNYALVGVLAPLVPIAFVWLEARGYRTLGRYLSQLRVVDSHGLPLSPRKRVVRSVIRNAPIWGVATSIVMLSLGLPELGDIVSPIDEAILVANGMFVLGAKKLALHDRIVGSQVVLHTN